MNSLIALLNRILENRRLLRKWRRTVTFLASVVVFVTTYMMILPAISVEKNKTESVSGIYLEDADIIDETQYVSADPSLENADTVASGAQLQESLDGEHVQSSNACELSASGDAYDIYVTYSEDTGIPDGVHLEVQEITQDPEAYASRQVSEYDEYVDNTMNALGWENGRISYARVFDISIMDELGEEVQPADGTTVGVRIELPEEELENVNVVHFDGIEEGTVIDSSVEPVNEGQIIEFETAALSVDAIVGTTIEKTVLASDGLNYRITATYGIETGIPEEADLEVTEILPEEQGDANTSSVYGMSYEEYVAFTENALGWEEGSAGYIRLFDIKIVNRENPSVKYQPKESADVDMRIELMDKDSGEEAAASTQVVHFHNEEMDGTVIENSTEGQIVSFAADGFSIYAIVDSSKRLQYNFYDGTNLLVSEYIKKQDNVLQELYEPGVEPEYGQTFAGWAYDPGETNPSNIYTIEELNNQAAARYDSATVEHTEINVYAIYDEAWYLRYMDEDAQGNPVVLNVVRVRKDAADKNVMIDYTFTPEEGIVFEGWMDVATGHTYQQGDRLTLDHHVDLYVKLQGRNWLVFDSNAGGPGSGATYIPPQLLIGNEATTIKPNDPTRRGYTFTGWNTVADGNGTWWYKADGSVNEFGNTLSADTTLYAQWEADDTDYYVIFWKQKATDAASLADAAKEYDYVSSEHRTAKTGATVSLTIADQQKGGTANREYGYYYIFNENNSDLTATVDANGTTVLNVYYDRREIKYNFSSNTDFTVPSYTGVVDGQSVTLTPDGSGGYTYQRTVTETTNLPYSGVRYDISNNDNDNNPQKYILRNGNITNVYYARRNNWSNYHWYTTNNPNLWSDTYDDYTRYVNSNTGAYGLVEGQMMPLNSDGTYTITTSTVTTEPYTGEITIATIQTRSASFTGLYGSTFSNWPDPGTNRVWTSNYNGRTLSLPLALTLFDPQAALDPSATQTTVNFTASNYSTGNTLTIYVQNTNGEWGYSDDYILTTANLGSNGTWYPTETFEGFTVHSYQIARTLNPNGTWTPITSSGSFSYNNNDVFLRYSRNKHNIHFISQGSHVTGRTENIVEDVYYESELNKYAEGGSAYYEPTNGNEGYYFAGWYADSDCQIPFDFNTTMPDNDITVYAKWDTYRVRVVLVPTPNNEYNDEVEFANNQSLSFRLDYNEQVDDSNINSSVAHRPGYKLIGWYYSPDFDPATEIHFPVPIDKDTPGVDMAYQSGEDWTKYGDNDGSHDNVRGILKLYAKWELDVDESSVYVEYHVDDVYRTYDTAGMLQTTIPVDDNKYALTNNNVTFQVAEAPTEYTSGFEFYRWVLLNPDGSESDRMYNQADTALEIPSSFIYEETVTDDLGHTATIKKIRLKAKFNIETEKVTTVTFDGNGGVTNDSGQHESITESYPINKDFLMKDEDSFLKEGYTLIGWAFEREDGSKITVEEYKNAIETMSSDELIQAGIYQPGQKVAADNLEVSDENNWDPLENTVYAVWEINTYTVTLKKVVNGENEVEKTFDFTAAADGNYALSTEDEAFALAHGGEKVFYEIPYGTILTYAESAASGYSIQSVVAKQTTMPNKDPLAEADYIDLGGANGKSYTIKGDTVITYTNEKTKDKKLRIHKIGDDAASGLAGATFDLKDAAGETIVGFTDMTGLVSMDDTTPSNEGYLPGGDATDETLFTLPIGTYSLSETASPQYYDGISGAVTLRVTVDGVSITSVGDDTEAPFDGVSMSSTADAESVYTLTISNTRKKASVTVIKNVEGIEADETAEYSFTPTGFNDGKVITLCGSDNESTADTVENQWSTKDTEKIPYGTTISLSETGAVDFNTSIDISQNGTTTTLSGEDVKATGDITVTGDVTITYTNTRKVADITLNKVAKGTVTPLIPGAQFRLYRKNSGGLYSTDESIDATKVETTHILTEGALTITDLPSGDYKLTETLPPDGYIIEHSDTYFTVNANGTGDVITATTGQQAYTAIGVSAKKTTKDNDTLVIPNTLGAALPSTGGPGTHLIYLLGIIFTSLAGTGLMMKRRMRNVA